MVLLSEDQQQQQHHQSTPEYCEFCYGGAHTLLSCAKIKCLSIYLSTLDATTSTTKFTASVHKASFLTQGSVPQQFDCVRPDRQGFRNWSTTFFPNREDETRGCAAVNTEAGVERENFSPFAKLEHTETRTRNTPNECLALAHNHHGDGGNNNDDGEAVSSAGDGLQRFGLWACRAK